MSDSASMCAAFHSALDAYDKLVTATDGEDESKAFEGIYGGRSHLLTVMSNAPFAAEATKDGAEATLAAALRAKLGAGHVATDEASDGERVLREAVGYLAAVLEADEASSPPPLGGLPRATSLTVVACALEGVNSLAVVYAGWDRSDDALAQLARARAAYAAARRTLARPGAPGDDDGDGGGTSSPSASPAVAAAAREVDGHFTRALFLAGQVHAQRGEAAASAAMYEATLTRQADEALVALQPAAAAPCDDNNAAVAAARAAGLRTWARHVQQLAAVGIARRWWRYAAYCLAAADAAAGQLLAGAAAAGGAGDAPQPLLAAAADELQAASAAEWAGLYAALLQVARQRAQAQVDGDNDAVADNYGASQPPSARLLDDADYAMLLAAAASTTATTPSPQAPPAHVPGAPFLAFLRSAASRVPASVFTSYGPAALPLPPTDPGGGPIAPPGRCASGLPSLPLPSSVITFDDARALFKAANAATTRALKYYVLDGFVSRHADLRCQSARLYHDLVYFEADPKREAAMHARRIDAVAPLLGELSPSVYTHLHAVLSREAAQAADDLYVLRSSLFTTATVGVAAIAAFGGPPPQGADVVRRRLPEVVAAGGTALRFYDHFSRCWADKRLPQPVPPLPRPDSAAPSPPVPPPSCAMPLEGDQVLPYLQAQLAATMLLKRLAPLQGDGSIAYVHAALERARWLVRCGQMLPAFGLEPADAARWRQMEPIVTELADLLEQQVRQLTAAAAKGGAPPPASKS